MNEKKRGGDRGEDEVEMGEDMEGPIKIDTAHGRGVWGHEVSPPQCLNHSSNAPWKTIKSARRPTEAPMSSPFSFSKN
jgi:hypothetical protein